MAIPALVAVHRHRGVGRMTADTEGGVEDMAKAGRCSPMINLQMDGRRLLVHVAVETIYFTLVGVGNDHIYRGVGIGEVVMCLIGIDVAFSVVTLEATASLMDGQDLREVANKVTVGTGLVIGLTLICYRVELNRMIDRTPQGAMIVSREFGGVAGDALGAAGNDIGRVNLAVRRVVAGDATPWRMDLTGTDKG